jgi:hypothetical protein
MQPPLPAIYTPDVQSSTNPSYPRMPQIIEEPCPRCSLLPANDECTECKDSVCHVCSRRFCRACGDYHCVNCKACLALWPRVLRAGSSSTTAACNGEFLNGSQKDFVCIYCNRSVVGPQLRYFPALLRTFDDGTAAHLQCIRIRQHIAARVAAGLPARDPDDSSDTSESGEDW